MVKTLLHIAAASLSLSLAAAAASAATPSASPLCYSLPAPIASRPAAASALHAPSPGAPDGLLCATPAQERVADPSPIGVAVAALWGAAGLREPASAARAPAADAVGHPEPQQPGWRWRRAGGMEYAVVAVAAVGTAYFEHENGRPTKGDWTSRNGFDEEIRSALRLKSRSARDATDVAGHAIMGLMIAAPVLDSLATLGIRDGDWDALLQTEMVNLESFTFTSLVSSVTQNLLARERPFVRDCRGGGDCESNLENRGFPSGHVAFAFTGAGLLCNHHRYQSLYNNPAADRAACSTGIGLAVADGVLRLVADRHYATDVAAGTVLGLFSGFVLPRLLHYSHPLDRAPEKKQGAKPFIKRMSVLPMLSSSGTGLSCEFRF